MSLQGTQLSQSSPSPFPTIPLLNRQEAQEKLQQLIPGTEEHSKLQDALIRIAGIVEIVLPTTSYRVDTHSKGCQLLDGFGSSEHVSIGEAVQLKGLPDKNPPVLTQGTLSVQFHHIVAIAGDFYEVPGQVISLPGGTDAEKTERFKQAFNTLAQAQPYELRHVVAEINGEREAVQHAALPHHCYSCGMIEKNRAIKAIKDDIDALLIDNSDHFFNHAKDAYRIGHTYALEVAREAGQQGNVEGLKRAYALDGFACHFLLDKVTGI